MAEVHDFEAERDRREVEKLLRDAKNFKGFTTDLDVCGMPAHFSGYCVGLGGSDDDRLRIIVYDTSGPYARPVGAIRIQRGQWQKMKELGDKILKEHASFEKERAAKF